ncbi:MAG: hypothetical protein ACOC0P_02960, partial [Planctomycetota bacterium]
VRACVRAWVGGQVYVSRHVPRVPFGETEGAVRSSGSIKRDQTVDRTQSAFTFPALKEHEP